jgi:hypothetical protein
VKLRAFKHSDMLLDVMEHWLENYFHVIFLLEGMKLSNCSQGNVYLNIMAEDFISVLW